MTAPADKPAAPTERYRSIDVLRGAAIILMVQVHFVENLAPRDDATGWLYDASVFLGIFPAPLFTFVSGLSYAVWLRRQQALGRPDAAITRTTLRRGLFLFVVGIAFNFFVWLPEDTFNWDVLTLLGTALLVLAFARHLPPVALVLICALLLLISPPVRVAAHFPAYWQDHSYTYDFTAHDIGLGFLANGYFPVFPWLAFPLAGFISAEYLFRLQRPSAGLWAAAGALLALAAALLALGPYLPPLVASYYANGLTEFPASTEYVLSMLGFALLSAAVLRHWDTVPGDGLLLTTLRRYSAFSLTVYVAHHVVMLWPLWLYGAWVDPSDPTAFWRRAMPAPLALALAAAFLAVCTLVLVVLEKHKRFTLEALMRHMCD